MKTPSLMFLFLSVLLAFPGLWFLLRQKRPLTAPAILLLMAATASAYIGVRLQLAHSAIPVPVAFVLKPADGQFQVIRAEELPAALIAAHDRVVMLEFYADWCPSCLIWKQQVFNRADVQSSLQPLVLLQVDASEMTPAVQAVLNRYRLPGLPAILIFDKTGHEQTGLRLLGEMPAEDFKAWIGEHLTPLL